MELILNRNANKPFLQALRIKNGIKQHINYKNFGSDKNKSLIINYLTNNLYFAIISTNVNTFSKKAILGEVSFSKM